uniref:G protein-coupled receptor n=1 Tax=Steinernema glaseri TaxID=37863 RepID=A0A1I8AST4_9BILA
MERYLFRKEEYARYYNCSLLTYEEWSTYADKRPILGTVCIVVGAINLTIYLPCLYVIRKPMFFKHSCFKIMFFLGLMDCTCVLFNSFLTGYFHIVGSVFILFIAKSTLCCLSACWFGGCFGCALLSFNRCCDFIFPLIAESIFDKNRAHIWIFTMFLYAVAAFFFEISVSLNSKAIMWAFDPFIIFPPHALPIEHNVFISYMNDYNRILLGSMVLSYVFFLLALAVKALLCVLDFVSGFIFFLLERIEEIPMREVMWCACMFMWQFGTGGGGLILIVFNRSIRWEVRSLLPEPFAIHTSTVAPPVLLKGRTVMINQLK